jgi:hypothetical protein
MKRLFILMVCLLVARLVMAAPSSTMSVTPVATSGTSITAADENARNNAISTTFNSHDHSTISTCTITNLTATNLSSSAVNIDGGTIDGVTIGGSSAPTVTNLGTVTTCDINGGTIDGATLGGSSAVTLTAATGVTTFSAGGNLDIGSYSFTAQTLISDVSTGTSPLTVSSTTKVTNLNADTVDGYNTSTTSAATTIPITDASGDLLWTMMPTSTARIKIGTYSGDNNATQAITGVGFAPDLVMIWPKVSGQYNGFKSSSDTTYAYLTSAGGDVYQEDHIISLDAGGFTVGDGTGSGNRLNTNGTTYVYVCIGD